MNNHNSEAVGPVVTVKEAATEMKCSISFVYKLMKIGELAFERRGRRKMPLAVSLANYRRRNLVQPLSTATESRSAFLPRSYLHLFTKERRQ